MEFKDILYEELDSVAYIAINRPEVMKAFRGQTVEELLQAFMKAGWDKRIAAIVLTGTGDRAFCTGGDQSAHAGQYDGRGTIGIPVEEFHSAIRDVPKPVIARVQGYAIGGGNVLATLCDMTIASEKAVFGQVGPKVGSVDPGWGTAYLSHVVGEKKAREIWYMCRRYSAQEALAMGLCNTVVPHDQLDAEVARWCKEIVEKSPTALAIAKRSFNASTEHIRGIGSLFYLFYALNHGLDPGIANLCTGFTLSVVAAAIGIAYGAAALFQVYAGAFKGKRAMLSVAVGGPAEDYSPRGINGPLEQLLFPITHGSLYFPGFDVLPTFAVYGTGHLTAAGADAAKQAPAQAGVAPAPAPPSRVTTAEQRPTSPALPAAVSAPTADTSNAASAPRRTGPGAF